MFSKTTTADDLRIQIDEFHSIEKRAREVRIKLLEFLILKEEATEAEKITYYLLAQEKQS